jgi:hypothetical protein
MPPADPGAPTGADQLPAVVEAVVSRLLERLDASKGGPRQLLVRTGKPAADLLGMGRTSYFEARQKPGFPAEVQVAGVRYHRVADLIAFVGRLKPARTKRRKSSAPAQDVAGNE